MFIFIISTLSLQLGHVASKTRSLGQITEKLCVLSRSLIFYPKFVRMLNLIKPRFRLKLGHVGSKTRSLGEILKTCLHSRVNSFD